MTTSADANPEDIKPEVEKKPEARKRKSEAKKAEAAAPEGDAVTGPEADGAKSAETAKSAVAAEDSEASKALAPAAAIPVDPFLAARAEDKVEPPVPPRSLASRMLDYSAHAAIIVGLIGFAWTVSGYVINRPKTDTPVAAAKSTQPDQMGELRLANIKMHEEIKSLKASVDALRSAARHDTTPEQVRMLSAGLDNVKSSLGATKNETNAAIAQLQGKVDKLAPGKMPALADRVGRLEHQSIDTASTGSIGRSEPSHPEAARSEPIKAAKAAPSEAARTAPKPPIKPAELANLEESHDTQADDAKPQVIPGWVVRDVYQGVALIEGKRGTLEVVPGVSIPGAGVVKSIERHGGGWTVTTSKGQLAYAGGTPRREQRDYRQGPYGHGYPYRYGY